MYTPEQHVLLAKELTHPFQSPPNLPMDLTFAAESSVTDVQAARMKRMAKAPRRFKLAEKAEKLDHLIWSRRQSSPWLAYRAHVHTTLA